MFWTTPSQRVTSTSGSHRELPADDTAQPLTFTTNTEAPRGKAIVFEKLLSELRIHDTFRDKMFQKLFLPESGRQ